MPIYEYRCRNCGEFELTQRITEAPLTRCPTCRGKVTKLISNTSFHLKGSGWYVTDYARKAGKGTETSPESKTESATEAKNDSGPSSKPDKSEAKSEPKASKSKEAAATA